MRVTFVQHGDYRDTVLRFAAGGGETYYAQRYSVDFVGDMVKRFEDVSVICVMSDPVEEVLSDGVHYTGMRMAGDKRCKALIQAIEKRAPTHLILRSPIVPILRWAHGASFRTLPLLADSFPRRGLRGRFRNWRLARELNRPGIDWVANHNVNSCKDLQRIGVDPAKIIPWDWPPLVDPDDYQAKTLSSDRGPIRLLYAGDICEQKGVGDAIEAVKRLIGGGFECALTIVGSGSGEEAFRHDVERLDLTRHIQFTGRVPHADVLKLMHDHDIVLVPSRHEYPEGLPMVIYDALSVKTPLLVSDHPMFEGKVRHRETAWVFRASDPADLAKGVKALAADADLYAAISARAKETWAGLRCPVVWGDLLDRWLRNSEEDRRWLTDYSLARQAE